MKTFLVPIGFFSLTFDLPCTMLVSMDEELSSRNHNHNQQGNFDMKKAFKLIFESDLPYEACEALVTHLKSESVYRNLDLDNLFDFQIIEFVNQWEDFDSIKSAFDRFSPEEYVDDETSRAWFKGQRATIIEYGGVLVNKAF